MHSAHKPTRQFSYNTQIGHDRCTQHISGQDSLVTIRRYQKKKKKKKKSLHIEHSIGLIQHEEFHALQTHSAALHQVH